MTWLLISAPIMVLALVIAVLPVLLTSLRADRAERDAVWTAGQATPAPEELADAA